MANSAPSGNAGPTPTGNAAQSSSRLMTGLKNNLYIIIFVGVTLLIFLAVILYIIWAMKDGGIRNKTVLKTPVPLTGSNSGKPIQNSKMPVPVVGREYTYSFWLYLENFEQTPGQQKMILYRGSGTDIHSANPIIYMDELSNKMYIVIKTQGSILNSTKINYNEDVGQIVKYNTFLNPETADSDYNKHIVTVIDYIPLQRWVNIAVIIDNKIITIYIDGEIYSVRTIDDLLRIYPAAMIVDKTDGDLHIGKNPSTGAKNLTINGYLSKIDFFNYAASSHDIKEVYEDGPFHKSFLSWLGLSNYGVQSPIYKISDKIKDS